MGLVMARFIILSFGFLGWVFFEMSGGTSFDASAMREARLAAVAEAKAERQAARKKTAPVVMASAAPKAPKAVIDTDPPRSASGNEQITRASLDVASLNGEKQDGPQSANDAVPQNVSLVMSSADTPAIIPSLIRPGDSQTAYITPAVATDTQGTASGNEDIRTVTGNRVNVRGGPGTDYGVVGKLGRGDAVRILENDGNGWVRLQSLDGDASGWMAEFLLDS